MTDTERNMLNARCDALEADNALLRQALRLLIGKARRGPVAGDAGGRTAGVAIHLEGREYDWAAGVLGGYAEGEGR